MQLLVSFRFRKLLVSLMSVEFLIAFQLLFELWDICTHRVIQSEFSYDYHASKKLTNDW